jgi:hypothetical protein
VGAITDISVLYPIDGATAMTSAPAAANSANLDKFTFTFAHCDDGSGFCPAMSQSISFRFTGYKNALKTTLSAVFKI